MGCLDARRIGPAAFRYDGMVLWQRACSPQRRLVELLGRKELSARLPDDEWCCEADPFGALGELLLGEAPLHRREFGLRGEAVLLVWGIYHVEEALFALLADADVLLPLVRVPLVVLGLSAVTRALAVKHATPRRGFAAHPRHGAASRA